MLQLRRILPRFLTPEDPSTVSPSEQRIRRFLGISYRILLSIFASAHLSEFLFSSIWMHGYIWSLNLPIDLDMSDMSAGGLVYHQLEQVGLIERTIYACTTVMAISSLLIFSGFASGRPFNIWRLFRLSVCVGIITAFVRTLQLKQRLFSSLHEGFYCYFVTFLVGSVLTLHPFERLPVYLSNDNGSGIQQSVKEYTDEQNNNTTNVVDSNGK